MHRIVAIAVAGALAAGSAAATDSCSAMRAQRLAHCCCPRTPEGRPALTCCTPGSTRDATVTARDREPLPSFAAPALAAAEFAVPAAPQLAAPPAVTLAATAAGPPLLPLRI